MAQTWNRLERTQWDPYVHRNLKYVRAKVQITGVKMNSSVSLIWKKINFQKKFQMNSMSNCVKRHLETRKKKKTKFRDFEHNKIS